MTRLKRSAMVVQMNSLFFFVTTCKAILLVVAFIYFVAALWEGPYSFRMATMLMTAGFSLAAIWLTRRDAINSKIGVTLPMYCCIAGIVSVIFDVYFDPRPLFPLFESPLLLLPFFSVICLGGLFFANWSYYRT